jgi:ABC-type glutathione transport system ATPase component
VGYLVSVKNLTIENSEKRIVSGLNFELPQKQISAIIGESGSGKSSFAMTLFGILPKGFRLSYSQYDLLGKDYRTYTPKDFLSANGRDVVLIPQNPFMAFHPYISVGNQVLEYLRLKNKEFATKELVIDSFHKVKLDSPSQKFDRLPGQLSGGERQRVWISVATILRPQILVADEPTTALDPVTQKKVLELLVKISQENQISVVFITHNIRIVAGIADDVTVLRKGSFVERAKVSHHTPQFTNPYSIDLFHRSRSYSL